MGNCCFLFGHPETLSEITDVGRYQVKLISADGKDFVLQTLDVEEVSK